MIKRPAGSPKCYVLMVYKNIYYLQWLPPLMAKWARWPSPTVSSSLSRRGPVWKDKLYQFVFENIKSCEMKYVPEN